MRSIIRTACACLASGATLIGVSAATSSAATASHARHGATHSTRHSTSSRRASGLDRAWLKSSLQGDLFEIAGGRLALTRTSNPAVIKLAQTLIRDHTKSFVEGARLARRIREAVPKKATATEQWELAVVATTTGPAFDRLYSSLEIADHKQDIDQAKDEIRMGTGDVRADAVRTCRCCGCT